MQRTLRRYDDRFVLGFIIMVLTFMTIFFLFYERFFLRSYFKNRKAFIKVLKSGECELVSSCWIGFGDSITEYVIRYKNETFRVWHWEVQNRVTVSYDMDYSDTDHIGLFVGSLEGLIQTKKIIKLVTNLK
jgi:hypothetical protein